MRFPFHTNVVGVTSVCRVNERLVLLRDHSNRYYRQAIVVVTADGQHIGLIRSDVAAELGPSIDRWTNLSARIVDVFGRADKTFELNIVVYEVAGLIEPPPAVSDGRLSPDATAGQGELRRALRTNQNFRDSFAKWIRRWFAVFRRL